MKKESPIKYQEISPEIRSKCEKGVYCPYCGQWARKYRKSLSSPIARFILKLYHAQQTHDRPYTTRELYPRDNKASTEGVLARHWGLIEVLDGTNSGGAPAGSYRLTDKGRQFALGRLFLPSHVYLYNGELLGMDGPMRDIHTALGKKWSYQELMEGRG